jgi:opacity protein-like surface antigen
MPWWQHPGIFYPAITAALSFIITAAVSTSVTLRRYDEAIQTSKVPPESSWSSRFGWSYAQSSPPRSRGEALRNAMIRASRLGFAGAIMGWLVAGFAFAALF